MLSSFPPIIFGAFALILLWQAFRVMGKVVFSSEGSPSDQLLRQKYTDDRTGRLTIHPELLDKEGRITTEDLLTVRFSEDHEPPHSAETSAE